jgi:sugar lactone lactonase YvrE
MRKRRSALQFFATGLDHPEGVAVGRDGVVYAGGEAGQVYRISPDGSKVHTLGTTGGFCLGLALDRDEHIFICDCKRNAVLVMDQQGRREVFADSAEGRPFRQPNFPVFDRAGNLYVSCSGDWGQTNGFLCRISPRGEAALFHPGPFHFAIGLALSAAEDFLYVVESTRDRVVRIPIGTDKSAGTIEVFAERLSRVPDGLAFDAAENLYVTCYASDTIYHVDPNGQKSTLCRDTQAVLLNRPTNCAFAGSRLLIANLGGAYLAVLDLAVSGMPLFHQR